MNNNKNISEQDLFNFVFFKENLSPEKIDEIENTPFYEDIVLFYSQLRNSIDSEPSFNTKQKIAKKIPVYKIVKSYTLAMKNFSGQLTDRTASTMAADSQIYNETRTVYTFIDEGNNYAVRLILENNFSKIYIFNLRDQAEQNLTLTFFPMGITIDFRDKRFLEVAEKLPSESIIVTVM